MPGAGSHHVLFNGSRNTRSFHHVPSRPDKHHLFNVCTSWIAGWLSCIFHGRTADLSAFLWLQEMLLSLLERHQELAPLSTYPGMLQGHQLPGSWTAPLTSKYQPEHSLASSPDLSLLDRANRAECLKEARLAANEWYYRRRKQRWRKKQDTNMKAKKEKMTAT